MEQLIDALEGVIERKKAFDEALVDGPARWHAQQYIEAKERFEYALNAVIDERINQRKER